MASQSDELATRKGDLDRRAPGYRDFGPQSRREFFAFMNARDGMPG
jgi:hypothetical protein